MKVIVFESYLQLDEQHDAHIRAYKAELRKWRRANRKVSDEQWDRWYGESNA